MSVTSNSRPLRMRTCAGCRERHPQSEMIRLRYVKDRMVIVRSGDGTAGRSIYLCPSEGCWHRALKRGRLIFKSAKRDRAVVHLDPREREQLLYRLKSYTREMGSPN
ncbi:YlxR family protein [bacterium]|nr:YlxR family protein [bacterium]